MACTCLVDIATLTMLSLPAKLTAFLVFFPVRKKFCIDHFEESDDVSVVPSPRVIDKYRAPWPPYKSSQKIAGAIRDGEKPGKNWEEHICRVLYEWGKLLCEIEYCIACLLHQKCNKICFLTFS